MLTALLVLAGLWFLLHCIDVSRPVSGLTVMDVLYVSPVAEAEQILREGR